MKNVDKYFSLKTLKKEQNSKRQKNCIHNADKAKSPLSRSNQDLIGTETEETIDRCEEAKIAEEAYAANIKLLKKQKARFIRLQRILSRNVFLIPLCAVFSVLSAASLFASTLTNHYELISYDISYLRRQIELENNNSLTQINSLTNSNFTQADLFFTNKKLLDKLDQSGSDSDSNNPNTQYVKDNKKTSPPRSLIQERLQSLFFYDLTNIIKDYYVVTRHNFPGVDNTSVKTNILYETHSGIWKFCNYLSGKQIRKNNSK